MRIVRTVKAMQRMAVDCHRRGLKVGFVPTMGCLHEGHLSLVQHARRSVGAQGLVALSIYVNPTQFGVNEDFAAYPRDLAHDAQLCRKAGVDVVFAPTDREMYPSGGDTAFSTYVVEEQLSKVLEGVSRPTHFRGVTTVVAKLFNIVLPDAAVFGEKDWQQAAVVQRMVRDLNFPLKVLVAPTVREPDGLAMSSRNRYLSGAERGQAVALWQAIQLAKRQVRSAAEGLPAARLQKQLARSIQQHPAAQMDYIAFFDPVTLTPARTVRRGVHLALAVFIGRTRLIDNARL